MSLTTPGGTSLNPGTRQASMDRYEAAGAAGALAYVVASTLLLAWVFGI